MHSKTVITLAGAALRVGAIASPAHADPERPFWIALEVPERAGLGWGVSIDYGAGQKKITCATPGPGGRFTVKVKASTRGLVFRSLGTDTYMNGGSTWFWPIRNRHPATLAGRRQGDARPDATARSRSDRTPLRVRQRRRRQKSMISLSADSCPGRLGDSGQLSAV